MVQACVRDRAEKDGGPRRRFVEALPFVGFLGGAGVRLALRGGVNGEIDRPRGERFPRFCAVLEWTATLIWRFAMRFLRLGGLAICVAAGLATYVPAAGRQSGSDHGGRSKIAAAQGRNSGLGARRDARPEDRTRIAERRDPFAGKASAEIPDLWRRQSRSRRGPGDVSAHAKRRPDPADQALRQRRPASMCRRPNCRPASIWFASTSRTPTAVRQRQASCLKVEQ